MEFHSTNAPAHARAPRTGKKKGRTFDREREVHSGRLRFVERGDGVRRGKRRDEDDDASRNAVMVLDSKRDNVLKGRTKKERVRTSEKGRCAVGPRAL